MTSKYAYFTRGLVYFLAAFLPSLSAGLIATQPLFIVLISSLGAGAVALAGFLDKTAGRRAADTSSPSTDAPSDPVNEHNHD